MTTVDHQRPRRRPVALAALALMAIRESPMSRTKLFRQRSTRLAAVFAAAALLLGACGGSDDSSESAGTDEVPTEDTSGGATTTVTSDHEESDGSGEDEASGGPCDLFSDEVAAQVLGIEIVRREPHSDEFGNVSCLKGTERVDDLSTGYYVNVIAFDGGAAIVDQFSANEGSQPVEGFGDEAVFDSNAGVLFIADGTDGISVQVVKAGRPGSHEDAVAIARDLFDRRG